MAWIFNNQVPVFIQITDKLRSDIINGKYKPDEQLPSVRNLALEASVNPNTMQRALAQLEAEGLFVSRGTVGRFITSDKQVLTEAREKIHRESIRFFADEMKKLGITPDELINYCKSEENKQ